MLLQNHKYRSNSLKRLKLAPNACSGKKTLRKCQANPSKWLLFKKEQKLKGIKHNWKRGTILEDCAGSEGGGLYFNYIQDNTLNLLQQLC